MPRHLLLRLELTVDSQSPDPCERAGTQQLSARLHTLIDARGRTLGLEGWVRWMEAAASFEADGNRTENA